MPANHRDRGAQLMTGIIDELPLRPERTRDPIEHRIERRRQTRQFVVAVHDQPVREIRLGDRSRSLLELPDRRQHPTGDQPRQAHREQKRDGSDRSRDPHGRVYRGTLAVNEQRGDEHIPSRPAIDCNVTGSATTRTVPADVWIVENVRRVTAAHRLTNCAVRLERAGSGPSGYVRSPGHPRRRPTPGSRRCRLRERGQEQLVRVRERPLCLRVDPGSLQRRDLVEFVRQLAVDLPRQTPHQHDPGREHRRRERPRDQQRAPSQDPKPRRNARNRHPPTPPSSTLLARNRPRRPVYRVAASASARTSERAPPPFRPPALRRRCNPNRATRIGRCDSLGIVRVTRGTQKGRRAEAQPPSPHVIRTACSNSTGDVVAARGSVDARSVFGRVIA